MEAITAGLVVILNGVFTLLGTLFTPVVGIAVLTLLGLGWLAIIEIEELNKRSSKPTTPLH